VPTPDEFGIPYEDVTLITPDKLKLKSYLIYARPRNELQQLRGRTGPEVRSFPSGDATFASNRPTIIYYHANAGNMGHRLPIAKVFWESVGCNVMMLSYRGYGKSEGSPSEKGLRIDAQTALDYVTNHPILGKTKIIVYGQSIGGCVCIDVASRNPSTVSAMIIENTPLSLPTLVPLLIPYLRPFLLIPNLLTEKWDAHIAVPKFGNNIAVLGLVGGRDELVVDGQMKGIRKLIEGREGADAKRIRWKEFPNGTHNDTYAQPGYFQAIADFIQEEVIDRNGDM